MAKGQKKQKPVPDKATEPAKPEPASQTVQYERKDKVAIVGFAGSSLELAPVNDKSWEIWGLNKLWMQLPRWDVWFELHPYHHVRTLHDHFDWLRRQPQGKPIFMQNSYKSIPASVRYPKIEIMELFGDYFTSTIAWMLALAISQKYAVIGVWGVDMLADTEYEYQRAGVDYYVGVARGAGIEVVIPKESALVRGQGLYGYEFTEPFGNRRMKRLNKRRRLLTEQSEKAKGDLYRIDGAILEAGEWSMIEHDEPWKKGRMDFLKQQREEILKGVYTVDGAIQELNNSAVYERHYKRGGA